MASGNRSPVEVPKTVHVLHKENSDSAAKALDAITALGVQPIPLPTRSVAEIAPLLARHTVDRLAVLGGDGMVHHAVQAIAGSRTTLGILPAGTGNDIARAFSIPHRLQSAVSVALGPSHTIDLIEVRPTSGGGDAYFAVSVLTAGFSGTVTEKAAQMHWAPGSTRYTFATLASLNRIDPFLLRPETDTGADGLPSQSVLVAFGNTAFFGGGMKICAGADPTDGLMEMVTVEPVGALHLAAVLPTAFIGQHYRSRRVHRRSVPSFVGTVASELWADGERLGLAGDVSITVSRRGLSIATPNPRVKARWPRPRLNLGLEMPERHPRWGGASSHSSTTGG